tara:strand:- start:58 stop:366 length:309 start_codon:yes stop_codon:yes gene_type:complete
MSKTKALKFLILQGLSSNSNKINHKTHREIATTIDVSIKENFYSIKWEIKSKAHILNVDCNNFKFYNKSEFYDSTDEHQIKNNEFNGNKLSLEIIEKSIDNS